MAVMTLAREKVFRSGLGTRPASWAGDPNRIPEPVDLSEPRSGPTRPIGPPRTSSAGAGRMRSFGSRRWHRAGKLRRRQEPLQLRNQFGAIERFADKAVAGLPRAD